MINSNPQTVADLLAAAESDPALRKTLTEAKDLPAVVQIGRDRGCEFTAEELKLAVAARLAGSGRLSDDDLENVAGGTEQVQFIKAVNQMFIALGDIVNRLNEKSKATIQPLR